MVGKMFTFYNLFNSYSKYYDIPTTYNSDPKKYGENYKKKRRKKK
jgi:hypothetical protein